MKHLLTIISCLLGLTLTAQEVVVEYPYNPDFENDGNVGVEDLMQLLASFGMGFDVDEITIDEVALSEWMQAISETLIDQQVTIDSLLLIQSQIDLSSLDSLLYSYGGMTAFGDRIHLGEPEDWGPFPLQPESFYSGTYDFDQDGFCFGYVKHPFFSLHLLPDSISLDNLSDDEFYGDYQVVTYAGGGTTQASFSIPVKADEKIVVRGFPSAYSNSYESNILWTPLAASGVASIDDIGAIQGPCQGEQAVNYHGYEYDLVEIGDQCWFAEDLQTSTFSNGDEIEQNWNWANFDDPWAMPSCEDHGGWIYNGPARIDERNLCPIDFRIPDESDWSELMGELYGQHLTAGHMNHSGINLHWGHQDYNNDAVGDCVDLSTGGV